MKCRPLRHGDQMQCTCGLAWDVGEEKPACPRAKPQCDCCDGTGWLYGDQELGVCPCVNALSVISVSRG